MFAAISTAARVAVLESHHERETDTGEANALLQPLAQPRPTATPRNAEQQLSLENFTGQNGYRQG